MDEERLRDVREEDKELLFHWANEKAVREASFQLEVITWEQHCRWFESMMEDTSVIQYIYENNGEPMGQVRLKIVNRTATINYSIAEEHRGKGKAEKMITLLEDKVKKSDLKIDYLKAEIKDANIISKRVFEKLNYKKHNSEKQIAVFEKNLT